MSFSFLPQSRANDGEPHVKVNIINRQPGPAKFGIFCLCVYGQKKQTTISWTKFFLSVEIDADWLAIVRQSGRLLKKVACWVTDDGDNMGTWFWGLS